MGIRDVKLNYIVETATALFIERSIRGVTVRDIAEKAEVGEATVYRYFARKQTIVQSAAEKLQAEVLGRYYRAMPGKSGAERLAAFYEVYPRVFREHPEFYRFVREFDGYLISEGLSSSEEYAAGIDKFYDHFITAYRDGVADGSVRKQEDPRLFYYATAHAMLELCKKLSVAGDLVRQDSAVARAAEIDELKRVILRSLLIEPQNPNK